MFAFVNVVKFNSERQQSSLNGTMLIGWGRGLRVLSRIFRAKEDNIQHDGTMSYCVRTRATDSGTMKT